MNHPRLTVRSLRARIVRAPMRRPLSTSATRMATAPFLLVDLYTVEGVTGRAQAFCYMNAAAPMMRDMLEAAGELIEGALLEPDGIGRTCRNHFTLLGTSGIVGMALSALDVACWDALSRAAGLPLGRYLGRGVDTVPAYNSNGLGLSDAVSGEMVDEANSLLTDGFDAIKIRLGRADPQEDLDAVRAVRSGIPSTSLLMSDYNQALSVSDALARGRNLEDEGLYWIEEPLAYGDLVGSAKLAEALTTPIQIGENFSGPDALATAIAMGALDYAMVDLMRIGGVSGWLRAAKMAAEAGIPMSSHLYPEVSVHLLAVTPTAHWLEYVDWAEPFILEPISISGGRARVPTGPGTGVIWDEDALARYIVD